jgi:hypothetical protein
MAGFLQVVLTPVRTCAHLWGLRILTDANFIPLLRVMGFDRGIRSPDYFREEPGRRNCRVFRSCPVALILQALDRGLDCQTVSDRAVAVENL